MSKAYESAPVRQVGFIGLGVMGAPMAGRLRAAGHEIRACNRTPSKAPAWVQQHGS